VRGEKTAVVEEIEEDVPREQVASSNRQDASRPRREKAPAAPRIGSAASEVEGSGSTAEGRRKKGRRRRRRSRGGR
jgi:hypothetical protein